MTMVPMSSPFAFQIEESGPQVRMDASPVDLQSFVPLKLRRSSDQAGFRPIFVLLDIGSPGESPRARRVGLRVSRATVAERR